MSRPRDKVSSAGLLPRMEARKFKYTTNYRYHPIGGKPVNLGSDKDAAIRAVLDMNRENSDLGTMNELWRLYQETPSWRELAQGSRNDYTQAHKPLLKVFGTMSPGSIKPAHIARYLRVEREGSPVRANREKALLSNLMNVAIERGDLDVNPCKQVKANKERPRKQPPTPERLAIFLEWAWAQPGQGAILAGMAEFASIAGNRGIEFRELTWPQIGVDVIRLMRAKQHGMDVVEEVTMDPLLSDLMSRLRTMAKESRIGFVFPNSQGNAYTAQAFKLGFARLKASAREAGKLEVNFTFHDLRAYYVTQYKRLHNALPELHADPRTTAKVYESSRQVNRKSL